MTQSTPKEQREQMIFTAFAKKSDLNINPSSIQSCEPPFPDIRCELDGSNYFFEIAESVAQDQARALATKGRYTRSWPDEEEEESAHAMVNIIKKKKTKKYETDKSPVDLIVYFNNDFAMDISDVKIEGADKTEIDLAVEECKQRGPFQRIWMYCSWKDGVEQLA